MTAHPPARSRAAADDPQRAGVVPLNRGTVPGLGMPYPIVTTLPAVYQEDPFTVRFLAGLDDVLAVIVATLDNIDAYLDPALAPEDFLAWLASWTGVSLDENWPVELRRALVASAVVNHRGRGTAAALRAQLELVAQGEVELVDSGGVAVSRSPGADLPGEPVPRLLVRVTAADPAAVPVDAVDSLVKANKPAHVAHWVEVATQ